LDPRFNYKKLKKDYANDPGLLAYLEEQKVALSVYFEQFYPTKSSEPSANSFPPKASESQPGIINFSDFDQDDEEPEGSELERYFDAPRAAPQTDPVQWWYARKVESPRLYQMARDFMAIPGK